MSVLALFQNSFKTTKIMRQGKTDSIELCTIFPFNVFLPLNLFVDNEIEKEGGRAKGEGVGRHRLLAVVVHHERLVGVVCFRGKIFATN